MRTTLNIDDELLKTAKIIAVRRGTTLTQVIEESLRDSFQRPVPIPELAVSPGGGRPGLDFRSTSRMMEQLDDADAGS